MVTAVSYLPSMVPKSPSRPCRPARESGPPVRAAFMSCVSMAPRFCCALCACLLSSSLALCLATAACAASPASRAPASSAFASSSLAAVASRWVSASASRFWAASSAACVFSWLASILARSAAAASDFWRASCSSVSTVSTTAWAAFTLAFHGCSSACLPAISSRRPAVWPCVGALVRRELLSSCRVSHTDTHTDTYLYFLEDGVHLGLLAGLGCTCSLHSLAQLWQCLLGGLCLGGGCFDLLGLSLDGGLREGGER